MDDMQHKIDVLGAQVTALLDERDKLKDSYWTNLSRLSEIESAARNLCTVKGRHHSEIAMRQLMVACGYARSNDNE